MDGINQQRDVRLNNKLRVLRFINRMGCATKQQISQGLGISLPTVLQNIKEMTQEGLIYPLGPMQSTGGRKAVALAPVKNARLAAGVAVWRHGLEMVMADLRGQIARLDYFPLPYNPTQQYYAQVAQAVEAFIGACGFPEERILGVGYSLPGIVRQEMITYSHVLGIRDVPTRAFSGPTGRECAFINDAKAAALAETHMPGSLNTFAYLSLNDCMGGSIIIGRRMYMGDNCRAAEFGHMKILPYGRRCYCGMEGCSDAFCAAPVLKEPGGGTVEGFFERLALGDKTVRTEWERYMDNLALCVGNLRMAFDCPIVIGGMVGGYLEEYLEDIRARVDRGSLFSDGRADYVQACRCRKNASALGAAMLITDRFLGEEQVL